MRKMFIILGILVLALSGCQQAAETAEANSNAENKPEEDLKTTLSKLENGAFEAWQKKDEKYFDGFLADNFVGNGPSGPTMKEAVVKSMADNPCEVKSFKISDEKVTELAEGVALYTTKAESDFTCKIGDKEMKGMSPEYGASVYVKDGDSWKAVYHQTVSARDAKGDPPMAQEASDKKEAAEPDEMTKALTEVDKKFWEAWSKKDTKVFEDGLASNFSEISPDGYVERAAAIKTVADHQCEVTSMSFSGAKSVKINDNLYMFMTKGSMEGKCGDQQMPKGIHGTTIYTKDGEDWKPVFHVGTPAAA